MHRTIRLAAVVLQLAFCLTLASCSAGIKSIPANYHPNSNTPNQIIAILRVLPKDPKFESSQLTFRRAGLKKDEIYFRAFTGDDSSYSEATPVAGYYVFSVEPTRANVLNAITSLEEKNTETGERKRGYAAGCAGYAFGFRFSRPGVYYLGDITYGEEVSSIGEIKLVSTITSDTDSLKGYLKAHYPALADADIKQGQMKKYWLNAHCTPPTITIYM